MGAKGVPHLATHDGRTIRYPDPLVKTNDTVKVDIETGKIDSFIKFDSGKSDSHTHDMLMLNSLCENGSSCLLILFTVSPVT